MIQPDRPLYFSDPEQVADAIIESVGRKIVLALPLGLGKANHVANALFQRAVADPSVSLLILTALTLEPPKPGSEIEKRFLEPLAEKFFAGYPALEYAQAMRQGKLPDNIKVQEFFLLTGRWLDNPLAQQNYLSINYTHVLEFLLRAQFNVLGQLIAPSPCQSQQYFSLSCNPDISVDLFKARQSGEINFLAVGQINQNLPYMQGEAERPVSDFDFVLQGDKTQFPLFTPPHEPVSLADHAIGLHVASLIPDGGTIQVGIGSIGDAICNALLLRHQENPLFQQLLDALGNGHSAPLNCHAPFSAGLYGVSEMLVEGFLHLLEAGILKREVDGVVLHAGFFLGSPLFYKSLKELPDPLREKIAMMPISFVNDLYSQQEVKRQARIGARFINSAIMTTLMGAVISDGLENGRVISGVGGQYNFVAMSFALEGARSIITLPATRKSSGRTLSNICWSYGHTTIPRHLRDIVVTEYGVADLRGKTDEEVIKQMLSVTDSLFQGELLAQAKAAGKINKSYRLPDEQRQNTPGHLHERLGKFQSTGNLSAFPLGSAFTDSEAKLVVALQALHARSRSKSALLGLALRGWRLGCGDADVASCLARMGLDQPSSLREWFFRYLLQGVLQ